MQHNPTLKTNYIESPSFLHDFSQSQFAFPALPLYGRSGLHAEELRALRLVGVKLSPNFSSSPGQEQGWL